MEANNPLLHLDRTLSDLSREICPEGSSCYSIIKILTESLSLQIFFAIFLSAFIWKASLHLKQSHQIKLLLSYAALFALGDLISNQLKYVFQRMRPDHAEFFLDLGAQGTFKASYSLPSNHAFNLFALSTFSMILVKKGYLRGVKFPIALFILATLVGISRVLVWRHYPLDIFAGLAFASIYALIFQHFVAKIVQVPAHTDKLD